MAGSWIRPLPAAPLNVGTALLLTDGSVLAQDDASALAWYRLRPDQTGDYEGGTWTQAASAHKARRNFASAVLADGRVLVVGGRSGSRAQPDPLSGEIYAPTSDTWADLSAPEGWHVLADAPCCVLPDGTVLVGNVDTGECALFDPEQNAWRPTGKKVNGSARGETWVLLPDGSVLSINGVGHPGSERYVGGQWQAEKLVPVAADLVEAVSGDAGPAILMADGTVFAIGATGKTAIFRPATADWIAGKVVSQTGTQTVSQTGTQTSAQTGTQTGTTLGGYLAAKDAPACLLPDGRVLFLAAEISGARDSYGTSSLVLEYDGTNFSQVGIASDAPRRCRLLVLPSGKVMLSDGSPLVAFYKPAGEPLDAGKPVIAHPPQQVAPCGTYLVRGRRLNGLSQACMFGDDAAMATNYPLVRLRGTAAPQTVTYCRTFDHSTMGVATGDEEHTTSFVVPAGVAAGKYVLEVVANGIASVPSAVTVLTRAAAEATGQESAPIRNASQDRALQEEMLWRDLNEVHLLMDFISGKADLSLTELGEIQNPQIGTGTPATLSAREALHAVSVIRFPPQGDLEEKARQAQLLLAVKDRLNRMAVPARGLSVAFTSMFSGTSGRSRDEGLRAPWQVEIFGEMRREKKTRRRRQETGFAIASYPNLEKQALLFKNVFAGVPWVALVWLLATALTYWDVALSSQALRAGVAGISVTNSDCNIAGAPPNATSPAPAKLRQACAALLAAETAGVNAQEVVARDGRAALFVAHWSWHPVGWIVRWLGPRPEDQVDAADFNGPCHLMGSCDYESDVSAFAGVVVSVFTDYILPMMFGVLGTLAGLIRGISAKVRDSTLSPRDFRLMFSLVPLGAVAGLAVGLLVTPSSSVAVAAGVPLTLSAAGLAFLAGYGADAFFGMIDQLLTKIFAPTPPSAPSGSK